VTWGLRAGKLPPGFLRAHRPGELVRYFGITSAGAAGGEPMAGDWTLHIDQTSGRLIEDLSLVPGQREVAVPPGALFEVLSVTGRDIYLRQVDEKLAAGRTVHEFAEDISTWPSLPTPSPPTS
jgi:hypothetical protein